MARTSRSLLVPVLLAGLVALGAGAVVILAFGDGGGDGPQPVAAAAAATTDAAPAPALPAAACDSFQGAVSAVDAALARLVGEDLSGAEGELPGTSEVQALDDALDALARDVPQEVETAVLALARLLREPLAPVLDALAAGAPAEGEEQLLEALVGLADVLQEPAYVESSGAVQDWAAAGCAA